MEKYKQLYERGLITEGHLSKLVDKGIITKTELNKIKGGKA